MKSFQEGAKPSEIGYFRKHTPLFIAIESEGPSQGKYNLFVCGKRWKPMNQRKSYAGPETQSVIC